VPTSVAADYGQYVEIHNTGADDVGLEGWVLVSSSARGVVAPSLVVPSGEYRVLCSTVNLDGVPCDGFVQPWPTFAPGDDALALAAAAVAQDTVDWDERWGMPVGASLELQAGCDGVQNDHRTQWCVASAAATAGHYGTPGHENDCGWP
jgi:hypothetical protein